MERKVRMVLGIAEHLLERPVASVLDVGCGEGCWQVVLRRLRPRARYVGVDSSAYVVRRYGARRNIRFGEIGYLERTGIEDVFDLVVCCDVLHYVSTRDVRSGLRFLAERTGALAYLEAYAWEEDIEGDRKHFQRRSGARYAGLFRDAGFEALGLHCYVLRGG